MENLTPLQKLDFVLREAKEPRAYPVLFLHIIQEKKLDVEEHDLKLIIDKLKKDGYVDYTLNDTLLEKPILIQDFIVIRRNFDGDLFVLAGGYSEKDRLVKQAIKDSTALSQRMERSEARLVLWTKRLAIATVAAACLIVAWEMFRYFYLEGHMVLIFLPLTIL